MGLQFHHLITPAVGESRSGDAVLIRQERGRDLFAVFDVLGHGPEAAKVADLALLHLSKAPLEHGVLTLVEGLHLCLRGTRGAAALLFVAHEGRVEGCGVGNVMLRSFGSALPIVLSPGVLGQRLPRLRLFQGPLLAKTRLVAFSDGISGKFTEQEMLGLSTRSACEHLLLKHRKILDDATALVIDVA